MNAEDVIDGIISDLVDGLIDLPDEEIDAKLAEYDLAPEDVADIKNIISAERMANEDAAQNPLSLEKVDTMADNAAQAAQEMANEDNSETTVTEEDSDKDGDTDKVTIEKKTPESDNAEPEEDKPHDKEIVKDGDETQKNIITALTSHRW